MHRVIETRDPTAVDADRARSLLAEMVRARTFDERAFALQRQGWMSGYPPFRGQEASQVGAASAMGAADWLVPTYRSNALQLARGVPMADILRFRRGHPEFGSDHDLPILPQAVPIASQIPHATGLAMAARHRGTDEAVVCCLGDGATSQGDFHEGLNFAGVFEAPVVFLCENNGWAISTPVDRQTRSRTIAEKAHAYGFEGSVVDGNDPLAVREVLAASLAAARDGEPVLVESLTYRQGPHTTADDPSRYEDAASYPEWRTADPIERFASYLRGGDVVDGSFVAEVREDAEAEFEAAREEAEHASVAPDDLFEPVYAEAPPSLERQRETLLEWIDRHGDPYEGG